MITPFKTVKWPKCDQVAVVGAGPSLDHFKLLLLNYEMVIGVNWTFKLVKVDYLVVTHMQMLIDFKQGTEPMPDAQLVYSEYASDFVFMGAKNPPLPGIRFTEYEDLTCGSSTIIPAIDLAARMTKNVHLFGVDMKRIDGVQYTEGYQTTKTQDDDFFRDWARVVERQIAGLQRHGGFYLRWFR